VWPTAPFKTADGTQLYYFASDVVGSPAAGDNAGGVWHVYTGPVTAA
jgi:predicted lipoprotein with Yx(FWY)xxD motif